MYATSAAHLHLVSTYCLIQSSNLSLYKKIHTAYNRAISCVIPRIIHIDPCIMLNPKNLIKKGVASVHKHTTNNETVLKTRIVNKVVTSVSSLSMQSFTPRGIYDSARSARDTTLSATILTSNVKVLSHQLRSLLTIQTGILDMITWKNQSLTLLLLVAYTLLCYFPHLLFVFPLLWVLLFVSIPNYLLVHSPENRMLLPDPSPKSFAEYLFGSFNDTPPVLHLDQSLADPSVDIEESRELIQGLGLDGTSSQTKMDILTTMSKLQVLTSQVVSLLLTAHEFYKRFLGFGNEHDSTLMFYALLFSVACIVMCGHWFPWRFSFMIMGHAFLLVNHPLILSALQLHILSRPLPPIPPEFEAKQHHLQALISMAGQIVVHETSHERSIQVFEVQRKSPLSQVWSQASYSNTMFLLSDPDRAAGREFTGVARLRDVGPPNNWKLCLGSSWVLDSDPEIFLATRGQEWTKYASISPAKDGWIYDVQDNNSDLSYEFRRRRLVHKCVSCNGKSPR